MTPKHDNVALIGMPAVGKSTVGVLLAKRLGLGFVDTDIVIQGRERQTLQQIIRGRGGEGDDRSGPGASCFHAGPLRGGGARFCSPGATIGDYFAPRAAFFPRSGKESAGVAVERCES